MGEEKKSQFLVAAWRGKLSSSCAESAALLTLSGTKLLSRVHHGHREAGEQQLGVSMEHQRDEGVNNPPNNSKTKTKPK